MICEGTMTDNLIVCNSVKDRRGSNEFVSLINNKQPNEQGKISENTHDVPLLAELLAPGRIIPLSKTKNSYKLEENFKTSKYNFLQEFIIKLKSGENIKNIFKCWGFYLTLFLVFISLLGTLIMFGTNLYDDGIRQIITLTEGGFIYNLWLDPKIDGIISVYAFNYTNVEAVLAGLEKPKVEELGPYSFRHQIRKVNVEFNGVETVTYSENITNLFMSEISNGSLSDRIITPNIPIFLIADRLKATNMLTQLSASAMIRSMKVNLFNNVSVDEYMFGYEDKLLRTLAKTMKFITQQHIPRQGLLNNRDGFMDERITVGTGVPNLDTIGMIYDYDGKSDISDQYLDKCNNLSIASDGFLFPSKSTMNGEKLYLYRKVMCRTMPLEYAYDTFSSQGYPVKKYVLPRNVFQNSDQNPENICYNRDPDLPSGLYSIAPCVLDLPLLISSPHFLNGDNALIVDNVVGLNPDPIRHSSEVYIHDYGFAIEGKLCFQYSVSVKKTPYLTFYKGFKRDTILPVGWLCLKSLDLNGLPNELVYHISFTAPLLKKILKWFSSILLFLSLIRLIMYVLFKL